MGLVTRLKTVHITQFSELLCVMPYIFLQIWHKVNMFELCPIFRGKFLHIQAARVFMAYTCTCDDLCRKLDNTSIIRYKGCQMIRGTELFRRNNIMALTSVCVCTYIYSCCGAGTAADTEFTTAFISAQLELHRLSTGRKVNPCNTSVLQHDIV